MIFEDVVTVAVCGQGDVVDEVAGERRLDAAELSCRAVRDPFLNHLGVGLPLRSSISSRRIVKPALEYRKSVPGTLSTTTGGDLAGSTPLRSCNVEGMPSLDTTRVG